nr:MAG TPA: Protein of unknown function (DUF1056) [Caudoviricetes sp.]
MRYTDDILYILGAISVTAAGFLISIPLGLVILGAAFLVSSYIIARYGGK